MNRIIPEKSWSETMQKCQLFRVGKKCQQLLNASKYKHYSGFFTDSWQKKDLPTFIWVNPLFYKGYIRLKKCWQNLIYINIYIASYKLAIYIKKLFKKVT